MSRAHAPNRILVTGAGGFIGRHVVRTLAERGYAVRAMLRNDSAVDAHPAVQTLRVAEIAQVDWRAALAGIDTVVHLAAIAHRGAPRDGADAGRIHAVNVTAVADLTAAAAACGVGRLLLLSSIGVLGANSGAGEFDHHSPPAPHDYYSQTKLDAECAAAKAAANSGLDLCIVRPPLVTGPQAPGNFGRMVKWVQRGLPLPFGAIDNRRSLISIWNLCDFLALCLCSPGAIGEPLLVADEGPVSTTRLLRLCARFLGRPARLLPVPMPLLRMAAAAAGRRGDLDRLCGSLVVDTRDTQQRMAWRAPLSLEEGLHRALSQ